MKKLISIIITISMLLMSVPAFAISGTGTESNPYLISSASDIAKIHDDLNGYYKLTNDINMSGVAFEPIGNENEGAFTGTIDGAGYTISNLNINLPENKYVGFVGYLEGTIKNLNLTNVKASGYRYVGGLVGYAEADSEINNCSVLCRHMGNYAIIGLNVGGVAGCNHGKIQECVSQGLIEYTNKDVYEPNTYYGGISGYNTGIIENCLNRANIYGSPDSNCYAGGISGYNSNLISMCNNFSENIFSSTSGGIVANNIGTVSFCTNDGNINSDCDELGGIVGINNGTIDHCINNANLSNPSYKIAGICAKNENRILCCENNGVISSYSFVATAGVCSENDGDIVDCINRGNVFNTQNNISSGSPSLGGITPSHYGNVERCINLGYIDDTYTSSYSGTTFGGRNTTNCYQLADTNRFGDDLTKYTILNKSEFTENNNFSNFDFNNIWVIKPESYSKIPQLQNMPKHIELNECVKIMEVGDVDTLHAYIDGIDESVAWSCDNSSVVSISSNGTITAKAKGICTVTAKNTDGMKTNCLIYVYKKADSFQLKSPSIEIAAGSTKTLTYIQNPDFANEGVRWHSSNENVATIDQSGKITAKKKGVTTITATTINSGFTDVCDVTVIGADITSIYFTSSSITMDVGKTKTLSYSISPSEYTGSITWSSSNENIATVDQNGKITGHSAGTTIITALSDTGKTAQCTVTVKAPATSINLNKNEITLEVGYTEKLIASMLPTNSTDTISWSSSSSTYASVSTEGIVTAKKAGTATITATTTSGQKAYCIVKVVNPVVPVASVTLDKTEHIMTKSETIQLKGSVLPSNATNKDLTWSTSDELIASVNDNGVVTANGVGIATITATSNNGMYHECIIKVVSASGPSILLTPENAIPNAISKVKASIVRNPGISGYKFTIKYDEALLTPVSVTANEEFGGTITTNLDDANRTEFNVVWYSNGDTDIDINGELFTIDFKVAETAELGDCSDISIEYGAKDICNTAGENIALYTESAKVTVEEPLPGDIYEDGDVNIYDLTLLARHMIGLADFTNRQMEAANVTDDDLVDIKDVVKLAQYVVGWTGVELMSLMSLNADVPKTPTVTVGTASVNDANEADIPVYIKNNTGIAAYRFVLDYNADDIEIVSITPSDFINPENFGTNLGQENDEGLIAFCYQEGNTAADGELFTVKVRYKNPTDTSVSPISIKSAENNFCNQTIENVAVNYETGYVLGDDYIVTNKVVGDTNFSCELYFDDSYAEQSAKAIIAFYDGDGRMVQLVPKDITVKPGKVDLSIDYDKKAYATYKLMIWEGMGNLKPITDVK